MTVSRIYLVISKVFRTSTGWLLYRGWEVVVFLFHIILSLNLYCYRYILNFYNVVNRHTAEYKAQQDFMRQTLREARNNNESVCTSVLDLHVLNVN